MAKKEFAFAPGFCLFKILAKTHTQWDGWRYYLRFYDTYR